MPVASKVRLLRAWRSRVRDIPAALTPILESAMVDQDRLVRMATLDVLLSLQSNANLAVPLQRTAFDPSSVDTLMSVLVRALSDLDRDVRAVAVRVLAIGGRARILSATFLAMMSTETDARVRAELISAMIPDAAQGVEESREAIMRALTEEREVESRIAAIYAMRSLRTADAVPHLVGALDAESPMVRQAASSVLRYFIDRLGSYRSRIETKSSTEVNAGVKSNLLFILDRMDKPEAL